MAYVTKSYYFPISCTSLLCLQVCISSLYLSGILFQWPLFVVWDYFKRFYLFPGLTINLEVRGYREDWFWTCIVFWCSTTGSVKQRYNWPLLVFMEVMDKFSLLPICPKIYVSWVHCVICWGLVYMKQLCIFLYLKYLILVVCS